MTSAALAKLLIERVNPKVDPRVATLLNRALLAIHTQQSLTAFLRDSGIVVRPDGTHVVQLVFNRLPQEVIPSVERLLSASAYDSFRWSQFLLNGQAVMGLELEMDPANLPSGLIDYAF